MVSPRLSTDVFKVFPAEHSVPFNLRHLCELPEVLLLGSLSHQSPCQQISYQLTNIGLDCGHGSCQTLSLMVVHLIVASVASISFFRSCLF